MAMQCDIRPGVEVFQVCERSEAVRVKEQMLVQHLVPENHPDRYGCVCDADCGGDFKCDLVLISCKWQVFSVELILVFAFDLLQMMASDH